MELKPSGQDGEVYIYRILSGQKHYLAWNGYKVTVENNPYSWTIEKAANPAYYVWVKWLICVSFLIMIANSRIRGTQSNLYLSRNVAAVRHCHYFLFFLLSLSLPFSFWLRVRLKQKRRQMLLHIGPSRFNIRMSRQVVYVKSYAALSVYKAEYILVVFLPWQSRISMTLYLYGRVLSSEFWVLALSGLRQQSSIYTVTERVCLENETAIN